MQGGSIYPKPGGSITRNRAGVRLHPLVEAMKAQLLTRPVLHADETPVPMLKPGLGRTHRAYLWSYATTEYDELKTVVYDFADGRRGMHAREFLGNWGEKLVCDDYSGYKALFDRGVIEAGCMAHARRKLHDLYANHRSEIAEEGLRYFGALYEIEGEARELKLPELSSPGTVTPGAISGATVRFPLSALTAVAKTFGPTTFRRVNPSIALLISFGAGESLNAAMELPRLRCSFADTFCIKAIQNEGKPASAFPKSILFMSETINSALGLARDRSTSRSAASRNKASKPLRPMPTSLSPIRALKTALRNSVIEPTPAVSTRNKNALSV